MEQMKSWMDINSWTNPFQIYMEGWNKMGKNLTDTMNGVSRTFNPFNGNGLGGAMTKGTKIYDALLKSMDTVANSGFDFGRKTMNGEEIKADDVFKTLRSAYDKFTDQMVDTLKDTPFQGVKEIDVAVKKSLDYFSNGHYPVKAMFGEMCAFNTKMVNLSHSLRKEVTGAFGDILRKGDVAETTYQKMRDAAGEALRQPIGFLKISDILMPQHKNIVDGAVQFAEKGIDVFISRMDVYYKSFQGVKETAAGMIEFTRDAVKDGKIPQDIFNKWMESSKKLFENPNYYNSVPTFIDTYTDFLKAGTSLYQSMIEPRLSIKPDIQPSTSAS